MAGMADLQKMNFTGNFQADRNTFMSSDWFHGLDSNTQIAELQNWTNSNWNKTIEGGPNGETVSYTLKPENYSDTSSVAVNNNTANTTLSNANAANIGGIVNGVLQFGQLALAAFDTWQSYQALQEAKEQFNKSLQFAEQNANNQVVTTNNRINSAVNISSALRNKSPEEAAKALQQSKEKYNVKEIHVGRV